MSSTLTAPEHLRYHRHLILDGFGLKAQEKLKKASVLVIGAGGLGCPALQYLTCAGLGTIGIVDFDEVEETNLQRQPLYTSSDIGKPKVFAARKALLAINPYIRVQCHPFRLDSTNALELFKDYDLILDGTDNFATRYLVNDACVLSGKSLVYGSIFKFEGQVAVFNALNGHSANYRDLYPSPPLPGEVPSCSDAGVLGVLPGMIGMLMANEVIKLITGIGETLSNKLLLWDALTMRTITLDITLDPDNPISGTNPVIKELIDYEAFCTFAHSKNGEAMLKEITPVELKEMMDKKENFQLIDVREEYEFDICNLGGELIPLAEVVGEDQRIARDKKVVVHCRSGKRSATAILELQNRFGFDNLYNLKGGILAWSDEVDPSIPKY